MNKKTIFSALILIVVALFMVFLFSSMSEVAEIKKDEVPVPAPDAQMCFTYTHEATDSEPYAVSEMIKINIKDKVVTGTKNGTQNGPDMTNGYEGMLAGKKEEDLISVVFAYTIEGSANQEREIYRVRADETGIEKLRYPLVEGKDMLIPDMTKDFTTLLYARVGCTASN